MEINLGINEFYATAYRKNNLQLQIYTTLPNAIWFGELELVFENHCTV